VSQETDAFISQADLNNLAFSNEIKINDNDASQNFPHIIIHDNYIHSVWVDQSLGNPDIYYGVSEFGSTLMRNVQKVNRNVEDSYVIQSDSKLLWVGNTLYCTWSDRRSGTNQVYLSKADLYPDYPYFEMTSINYNEIQGDLDGVINPGETISLIVNLEIPSNWYVGGEDIFITISANEDYIEIENNELFIGEMEPGDEFENSDDPIIISFNENIPPDDYQINLAIESNTIQDFIISLDVSLQQFGFPLEIFSMIKSSPLIMDINNDGSNEVIFGDYSGIVHVFNNNGTEIIDGTFPYDTGNQIWGSPAGADLNGDDSLNVLDIVLLVNIILQG